MTKPGNDDRFVRLLEEHKRILYRVTNVYCRDTEDRRDLVQEMVIQLWRSFPRYDDNFKFATWMYRIAMNVAISSLRSTSRRDRDTVSIEQLDIVDFASVDQLLGETGDDRRELQKLIAGLDEMSRALIILYLDGHTQDEISEILGISVTNVGTRVSRVKQRLQDDAKKNAPTTARRVK